MVTDENDNKLLQNCIIHVIKRAYLDIVQSNKVGLRNYKSAIEYIFSGTCRLHFEFLRVCGVKGSYIKFKKIIENKLKENTHARST